LQLFDFLNNQITAKMGWRHTTNSKGELVMDKCWTFFFSPPFFGGFLVISDGYNWGGKQIRMGHSIFHPHFSDFLVISDGYDGGEKKSPGDASAPSKKSRSGISWMGWNCPPRGHFTWSLDFFILELFFFGSLSLFFLPGLTFDFFYFIFFLLAILEPKFLLGTPTYLSNLPTSLLPPNPSTSSILPTPHLCSPP
jgi:hypothetical protein